MDTQNSYLDSFEFEALSLLRHHWATDARQARRLPVFRKAVGAEVPRGRHRQTEPELIVNEKKWVREAIKWAAEQPNHKKLAGDLGQIKIPWKQAWRPFPVPKPLKRVDKEILKSIELTIYKGETVSETLINKAVAVRLCVDEDTVDPKKRAKAAKLKKSKERGLLKLSDKQSLLVSVFVDVCLVRSTVPEWKRVQAEVLDALYWTKCPTIFIFHLVRTSHNLLGELFLEQADPQLFRALLPRKERNPACSPFTDLVSEL